MEPSIPDIKARLHDISIALGEVGEALERMTLDERNRIIGDGECNLFALASLVVVRDLTDANCIDIDAGTRNGIDRIISKLHRTHKKQEQSR